MLRSMSCLRSFSKKHTEAPTSLLKGTSPFRDAANVRRAVESIYGQAPGVMLMSHHVHDCRSRHQDLDIQAGIQMLARAAQASSPDARRAGT